MESVDQLFHRAFFIASRLTRPGGLATGIRLHSDRPGCLAAIRVVIHDTKPRATVDLEDFAGYSGFSEVSGGEGRCNR